MLPYLRRIPPAACIALLFILAGLAFIGKTGLHYDAAYELACFYKCSDPAYRITLFGYPVPVMVIQYLGSFKAWLYLPILLYLNVTPFVLRLPLLVCAAGSVWLSFALLDRISGRRAAVTGSLLLATDAVFVIASTYDFGPIVFLHFFLLAGLLLLLKFERTRSIRYLWLAFFLFGVALWHKALFIWMINGVVVASLIAVPDRIRAVYSPRRLLVAGLALCLGALPLIGYNVVTGFATFRTGEVASGAAPFSQKLRMLRTTLDGSVMFGWLAEEAPPATAKNPTRFASRASLAVSRLAGRVQSDLLLDALVLSILALPWLWFTPSRRAALFVAVYLAITWPQMLLLPNTGGAHHVILLWPFPHFLIAIALSQVSFQVGKRGLAVLAGILSVLVGSNCLVLNQYFADLVTNGPTAMWTDATVPLFRYLEPLSRRRIVTTDWGYSATLCLLSDGAIPSLDITQVLRDRSPAQRAWLGYLVADSSALFVNHISGRETFPGQNQRLAAIAADAGLEGKTVKVIEDRFGRPRFQISRFVPKSQAR
jgi:hypothetical protein